MRLLWYVWGLPYLRWHILFVFIPTLVMWFFWWKYLLKYKKTILFIAVVSFVWGLLFDIVASPFLGVWHFNTVHSLGISYVGLPLEEYLFLLFVPQELSVFFLLVRGKVKDGKI